MDPLTLIALLNASAKVVAEIVPVIRAVRATATAEDQAAIDEALAKLFEVYDDTRIRVQGKLADAAKA